MTFLNDSLKSSLLTKESDYWNSSNMHSAIDHCNYHFLMQNGSNWPFGDIWLSNFDQTTYCFCTQAWSYSLLFGIID